MATIQIRDIPPDAYEVIRSRAQAQGRSMQAYLREVVIAFAARPTPEEVLDRLDEALAGEQDPRATRESILSSLAERR